MKLVKKQLLALPVTPLPQEVHLPGNREVDYIYTAAPHGEILAVDLYGPEAGAESAPGYRVFCTRESWAVWDAAEKKWGRATLEHLGRAPAEYWRRNQLYAADKASAQAADGLLEDFGDKKTETAQRVRYMQGHIQREKERARSQRKQEETADVMAAWPGLPRGWEQRLEDGLWGKGKYCFYSKAPRDSLSLAQRLIEEQLPGSVAPYLGLCSSCGESFPLPGPLGHVSGRPEGEGEFLCPCCGARLHPKKAGLGRGGLGEKAYLLLATEKEGRVYLDLVYARRDYAAPPFKTGESPCYRWLLDTRANTAAMWERWGGGWRKRERVAAPPMAYAEDLSVKEAVGATRLRYGEKLLKACGRILAGAALSKYPALELVAKAGSLSWARQAVWGAPFCREAMDLKGKTMREVMGLTKEELAWAKGHCADCFELYVFRALRREGKWHSRETEKTAKNITGGRRKFAAIGAFAGMSRALAYVEKQGRFAQRGAGGIIGFWADYLKECRMLGYDLTDPYNLFPPDLLKAHGRTMKLVSDMQDEGLNRQIANRLEKLREYAFSANGLLIRPAQSVGELKEEGERLHHCVATYAGSYARGVTGLFLVRRREAPETPFVTVEYKGGAIAQARGDRNGPPPEGVRAFLKQWTDWLKKKGKKEAAGAA